MTPVKSLSLLALSLYKNVSTGTQWNMITVYDATIKRLEFIFSEFDNVYVSFSGGKDSGVLLNLCIDFIRKNRLNRKLGVLHLDYEAQYEMTTDYVNKTLKSNSDILDVYRCCVPFKVTTCTSMFQTYWRPWDPAMKDLWVSPMPDDCLKKDDFDFYKSSMWDYEFQEQFSVWLHKRKHANGTWLSCWYPHPGEPGSRWRAIHSDRNYKEL